MKDWGIDTDKLRRSGIDPSEWNFVGGVVENTVAEHTDLLHGDGCRTGWRVYATKEAGPGEGWLTGAHACNAARQPILDLIEGQRNYIFACATPTTPNHATVRFRANLEGVAYGQNYGGAFIGTLTLDTGGDVLLINGNPVADPYEEHVDKQWTRRLQFEMVDAPPFDEEPAALSIPALTMGVFTIPHPTKRFRGAGTLTIHEAPLATECAWLADLSPRDGIKILAMNLTNYVRTFTWRLRREGLAQ